jgi:predicted esterase
MKSLASGLALAIAWCLTVQARASGDGGSASRQSGPCEGCRSSLPSGSEPAPLLVLLHGDRESVTTMFDAWVADAEARGIAVLALACPRSEGCTQQSWWRWNGSPSWIGDQARALSERRAIDPARMWIVGWSGGASYIGYRTQEIERTFAAIVIHGGGMSPASGTCSTPKASVYFLVGSANPLHHLAEGLRAHYEGCGNDATWTLLRGAGHDGEWRALAKRREAILGWLSTRRMAPAPEDAEAIEAPVPSASTPLPASTPPASTPSVVPSQPLASTRPAGTATPPPSCRCSFPGSPGPRDSSALSLLLAAGLAWMRRPDRGRRTRAGASDDVVQGVDGVSSN